MSEAVSQHGQWSSRWAYFLAATGSAIGLGNIWKFPYIVGENGGGAFVLVYLFCIALIGLPVLLAEVLVGRCGRSSPERSLVMLAREHGASRHWRWVGWMGACAGVLILSFYTVVAGWALHYWQLGMREGFGAWIDVQASSAAFSNLTADPWLLLGWSSLFLLLTMLCIGRGVERGLELVLRYVMPLMFVLLVLLVGYAMSQGAFSEAMRFLFEPRFEQLSAEAVLVALGHAFFTLGLGAGAMMVYGAYVPPRTTLGRTGIEIALADTAVALLAGMAIFPLVFANHLEPSAGPALLFISLPLAFAQMPAGDLIGVLFFVMLACAAFSSAISMVEAMVVTVIERTHWPRWQAATLVGVLVWLLSLGTVVSFNVASDPWWGARNFFEWVDHLTANILLPLTSAATALFVGWVLSRETVQEGLGISRWDVGSRLWYGVIRYLSPMAIALLMIYSWW